MYVAVPGGPGVVRVAADLAAGRRASCTGRSWPWRSPPSWRCSSGRCSRGSRPARSPGRSPPSPRPPGPSRPGSRRGSRTPASATSTPWCRRCGRCTTSSAERFDRLRHEQAESAALVAAMVEGVVAADGRGRILTANPAARRLLGYGPDAPLPDLQQLFRAACGPRDRAGGRRGDARSRARRSRSTGARSSSARGRCPTGGRSSCCTTRPRSGAWRRCAGTSWPTCPTSSRRRSPASPATRRRCWPSGRTSATERQFLETILGNAHRMQRLVDDLLDLSRIESGRWQPEVAAIDVAETAARGLGRHRRPRRRGAGWPSRRRSEHGRRDAARRPGGRAPGPPEPAGQRVRYTPRGGRITLRSAVAEEGDRHSRWRTPGAGSRRSISPASSSGSTGWIRRGRGRRAAPGWGWPSCGTPWRRTAAGWASKASSGSGTTGHLLVPGPVAARCYGAVTWRSHGRDGRLRSLRRDAGVPSGIARTGTPPADDNLWGADSAPVRKGGHAFHDVAFGLEPRFPDPADRRRGRGPDDVPEREDERPPPGRVLRLQQRRERALRRAARRGPGRGEQLPDPPRPHRGQGQPDREHHLRHPAELHHRPVRRHAEGRVPRRRVHQAGSEERLRPARRPVQAVLRAVRTHLVQQPPVHRARRLPRPGPGVVERPGRSATASRRTTSAPA